MEDLALEPQSLLACRSFAIGRGPGAVRVGGDAPIVFIAGPCVIESRAHALSMARQLKEIADEERIPLVFKASYDKANRSSAASYRGPGIRQGLEILAEAKAETGLPVLTDFHAPEQAAEAASVADMIQIPAFLCRQTDLLLAAAAAGVPVNAKKAQFMAAEDMGNVVDKLREGGCEDILLTERGTSFGYRTLVSDFRGLRSMQDLSGLPVCFDATHSVQQPGGLGSASGGDRRHVPTLARAAAATGINAVFVEVHDDPDSAMSDGPNMLPLSSFAAFARMVVRIDEALREGLRFA